MLIERTIRIFMLVTASLGAGPLWIHHATHHCGCSSPVERAVEDCGSCCSHHEPQLSLSDSPDSEKRIQESDDDCWLCFNLSQAQVLGLWLEQSDETATFTDVKGYFEPHVASSPELPPPARAPPTFLV